MAPFVRFIKMAEDQKSLSDFYLFEAENPVNYPNR